MQDLVQINGVQTNRTVTDSEREDRATQQVHPQSGEGVLDGSFFLGVTDEQEGHYAGDFPEEVDPNQGAGQHQTEHCAQENVEHRKEERSAILHVMVMVVIFLHVAKGIDADQTAHDGNDQAHQQGQTVQADHACGLMNLARQLQPSQGACLIESKNRGEDTAILDGQPSDQQSEDDLDAKHCVADDGDGRLCEDAALGRKHYRSLPAAVPQHSQGECQRHDGTAAHKGENATSHRVANSKLSDGDHKGE